MRIMFNIGDQVIYGSHGACTVIAVESMRFGKTRGKYYCLQPLEHPDSRYYVPVDNEAALAKLSPLMSAEALLELLHSEHIRENNWIDDESRRKQHYRDLISSADRSALLNMIYCLHRHKEAQLKAGKKFHQCDEGFLNDAQKLLNSEFSLVFGIAPGDVGEFIAREMGA